MNKNLLFQETHEWLELNGNKARIGITDYAQDALGAIVYIELPSVGETFDKGETFGAVESVKSASDLYMPVSGKVIAINEELTNSPELVNEDPYKNFFIEIEVFDESELKTLIDEESYKKTL